MRHNASKGYHVCFPLHKTFAVLVNNRLQHTELLPITSKLICRVKVIPNFFFSVHPLWTQMFPQTQSSFCHSLVSSPNTNVSSTYFNKWVEWTMMIIVTLRQTFHEMSTYHNSTFTSQSAPTYAIITAFH